MKKILYAMLLVACLGFVSGCTPTQNTPPTQPVPVVVQPQPPAPAPVPETTTITYYLSAAARTEFCNGAAMDDIGFGLNLTKKVTVEVPKIEPRIDIIKKTYELATEAGGFKQYAGVLTIAGDTATITNPNGGWAGESIFNRAWHPFAEKNLKQFPEITKVVFK